MNNPFAQYMNDPEEAQRLLLDGRQVGIWTALPGIVTFVDLIKQVCEVQPAIQGQTIDENNKVKYVNLPVLINVPIVFPSGGGFSITFPLAIGDEVLVVFASRCIDAWWQLGGSQVPMELRMHDLSDGFAIPGPSSVPNIISEISTTSLQIRSDDGNAVITITPDDKIFIESSSNEIYVSAPEIFIEGGSEVTVNAPTVNVIASTAVNITSPLATINGNLVVTGEVTAGVIPLTTHIHPGVTSGGADTGTPIP